MIDQVNKRPSFMSSLNPKLLDSLMFSTKGFQDDPRGCPLQLARKEHQQRVPCKVCMRVELNHKVHMTAGETGKYSELWAKRKN